MQNAPCGSLCLGTDCVCQNKNAAGLVWYAQKSTAYGPDASPSTYWAIMAAPLNPSGGQTTLTIIDDGEMEEETAARIVRAVNIHEELVRTAKAVVAQIRKSPNLIPAVDALYDAISKAEAR